MNEVYAYRSAPGKGAIWLALAGMALVLASAVITGRQDLMQLVWVFGAVTLAWMLIPRHAAGIRIDDETLVLSAWRKPQPVPLDDIAYLRATPANIQTDVTIVFKDGREQQIFAGDLPDIDTLVTVMALRGIPVRGIY